MNAKSRPGRNSDIDTAPSKKYKAAKGSGKLGPKASSWDRIRNRSTKDTIANRDVHGAQQLERGEIGRVRGEGLPKTAAIVIGILAAILAWTVWGLAGALTGTVSNLTDRGSSQFEAELKQAKELGVQPYFRVQQRGQNSAVEKTCYLLLDPNGQPVDNDCNSALDDIARPQWHVDATQAARESSGAPTPQIEKSDASVASWLGGGHVSLVRLLATLLAGLAAWSGTKVWLLRKLDAQNLMYETSDINQYDDDQHIAVPEEVIRQYGIFPDVGAHSFSAPSSLLGHAMLSSRGAKKVRLLQRYESDVIDENGETLHYKGEVIRDENGHALFDQVPILDEAFAHKLFDASDLPADKSLRKFFNPQNIPYNPGGVNRDKQGSQDTIAKRIDEDWVFPEYEPQRPAGVYFVDEAPVNTMVLAMTRAGKGQTYIEPMLDMWQRERRPNNMVINDPKGELLVKNYVRASVRGFQVVQFNLINALKTDIYNPLGMAAEAAREGNSTACALYVENIAEVFFPVDNADDPVWPNAANNAFKRTAYGMIDFYLEEERQMRKQAAAEGWDLKVLETKLDESWGKVTLYNCYQLFVQLSAKKLKDPITRLNAEVTAGAFGDLENDLDAQAAFNEANERAKELMPMWNGEQEVDMLTLFFNATDKLPVNSMRTLVGNSDKALRAMGGAEKMLASVYGIAITAMSFFVDPTISTLTSGTLSQNIDLGGMSFPRRFGVRFDQNYVRRYNLIGMQAKWDSFTDANFEEPLGKDYEHEDTVSREGWARAFFEGIYPNDIAYLRLRLLNTESGTLVKTFYFRFTKSYQTDLKGRIYIKDPVLETKIVKNGLLAEMVPGSDSKMVVGSTTFEQEVLNIDQLTLDQINSGDNDLIKKVRGRRNAVLSTQVHYSEKPKAVFLVTPPHLMKYAKLILILLKQLVDLNFDKSYMTKSTQKPLYKTRYMLDELGNLQSEGHGIAGFETMLSIGLGQEQQFTLILQTLQQLRDVYGESVDKIVQGNAANLVFLKSTDDSMLDTLQKMSGTRHQVYRDSKSVTKNAEKVAFKTAGTVTYNMTAKEIPVISYNDLAFLPPRNSIVFSAGAPPIWNRNETILPMSFALFGNTIAQPGKDYSLQTIPTLSSARDFDVRLNQPNFFQMVEKRMAQAAVAPAAEDLYRNAYGYSDFDMTRLDPDVSSNEVMDINDVILGRKLYEKARERKAATDVSAEAAELAAIFGEMEPPAPPVEDAVFGFAEQEAMFEAAAEATVRAATDDVELEQELIRLEADRTASAQKIYAEGWVSKDMLIDPIGGRVYEALDKELAAAYAECWRDFDRDELFALLGDNLVLRSNGAPMITARSESAAMRDAARAAADEGSRVHMEQEPDPDSMAALSAYRIHPEFKKVLSEQSSWRGIADGHFEAEMAKQMSISEN
ncbi:type IV secretory system conjugative DNA transfer family protein [Rhodococcus sp. Leaf233]|uniref:type IV secretory system conjugative DNA transfer family protein n=1 Tax=Rhodococcus sp. Leaf233 TaxID=1736302 RepID=UPI00070AE0C6|nr:type IV secretory system conjugative DNA transfer family protein [Rhodococcus sp. Leaf233]KQU35749.1 ATPase [Rhodococcus sp. Leaf233]